MRNETFVIRIAFRCRWDELGDRLSIDCDQIRLPRLDLCEVMVEIRLGLFDGYRFHKRLFDSTKFKAAHLTKLRTAHDQIDERDEAKIALHHVLDQRLVGKLHASSQRIAE
jgi:hypothetical protein